MKKICYECGHELAEELGDNSNRAVPGLCKPCLFRLRQDRAGHPDKRVQDAYIEPGRNAPKELKV